MPFFKLLSIANFKIRSKLLFLTVFLVLIAAITGGSGLFFITNISNSINNLSEIASPLVKETAKMVKSMDDIQSSVSAKLESTAIIDAQDVNGTLLEFDKASEQSLLVLVKLLEQNGEQLDISEATKARQLYINIVNNGVSIKNNIIQLESKLSGTSDSISTKRKFISKYLVSLAVAKQGQMSKNEKALKKLMQSGETNPYVINSALKIIFDEAYPIIKIIYTTNGYLAKFQDFVNQASALIP